MMNDSSDVSEIRALRNALHDLIFWQSQLLGGTAVKRAVRLQRSDVEATAEKQIASSNVAQVPDRIVTTKVPAREVEDGQYIDGKDVVVFELAEKCMSVRQWPEILNQLQTQLDNFWKAYEDTRSTLGALRPSAVARVSERLKESAFRENIAFEIQRFVKPVSGTQPTVGAGSSTEDPESYPADLPKFLSIVRSGLIHVDDEQLLVKRLDILSDLIAGGLFVTEKKPNRELRGNGSSTEDQPARRKKKGPSLTARLLVVNVLQTHHCKTSGEINQEFLGMRKIAELTGELINFRTAGRHRDAIFGDYEGYKLACRDRTVCDRLRTVGELREKAKTNCSDNLADEFAENGE